MVEAYLNLSYTHGLMQLWLVRLLLDSFESSTRTVFGGENRRQMCHTYLYVSIIARNLFRPKIPLGRPAPSRTCCPLCWWRADLHRGLTVSRPFFSRKSRCDVALARRIFCGENSAAARRRRLPSSSEPGLGRLVTCLCLSLWVLDVVAIPAAAGSIREICCQMQLILFRTHDLTCSDQRTTTPSQGFFHGRQGLKANREGHGRAGLAPRTFCCCQPLEVFWAIF